jgi:hypothetical protein
MLLVKGWYNQTIAYSYDLAQNDLNNITGDKNINNITREDCQLWLDSHAGDFQSITDFCVDIKDFTIDWNNSESELIWNDCIYGEEEVK